MLHWPARPPAASSARTPWVLSACAELIGVLPAAGSVTTTYGYNSKDLVEWETLSVDGQAFTLNYGYNSTGNLTTTIYPGGASIGYAPNALTQPTQAGSYATGATYHPSGMVKSHNYANGFVHTSTLNNSGLPATFHDLRASTYALNHAFSYDANHNLTFWDDKVNNAYDVQATYDGLDRLNTITDSYLGAGDVNYDAMGNITYYKLGSQAITYVYDSAKRLVQTTGSQSYAFTYDDRGRPVQVSRTVQGASVTPSGWPATPTSTCRSSTPSVGPRRITSSTTDA